MTDAIANHVESMNRLRQAYDRIVGKEQASNEARLVDYQKQMEDLSATWRLLPPARQPPLQQSRPSSEILG